MVWMGLLVTELHAPRRSRMRRLPWESAIGRSATSASSAILATDIALSDNASASALPTGPPPAIATSTSASSAAANERLDVANRFRRGRRQYVAAGGGHDDVVLDANAGVPELPGDTVARPDIAARLDGQGHARFEATPFAARFVFSGVVNVQTQPVPGTVHVKALVVFGFDDLFERAAAQAEVDETPRQRLHRGVVRLVPAVSDFHRGDRRGLRREHQLVDVFLRPAEFPAHGKSAGQVR